MSCLINNTNLNDSTYEKLESLYAEYKDPASTISFALSQAGYNKELIEKAEVDNGIIKVGDSNIEIASLLSSAKLKPLEKIKMSELSFQGKHLTLEQESAIVKSGVGLFLNAAFKQGLDLLDPSSIKTKDDVINLASILGNKSASVGNAFLSNFDINNEIDEEEEYDFYAKISLKISDVLKKEYGVNGKKIIEIALEEDEYNESDEFIETKENESESSSDDVVSEISEEEENHGDPVGVKRNDFEDLSSHLINDKNRFSKSTKLIFSSILDKKVSSGKVIAVLDKYGLPKFHDFKSMYNKIVRRISIENAYDFDSFINELAKINNDDFVFYNDFLEKIGVEMTGDGLKITKHSPAYHNVRMALYKDLHKTFLDQQIIRGVPGASINEKTIRIDGYSGYMNSVMNVALNKGTQELFYDLKKFSNEELKKNGIHNISGSFYFSDPNQALTKSIELLNKMMNVKSSNDTGLANKIGNISRTLKALIDFANNSEYKQNYNTNIYGAYVDGKFAVDLKAFIQGINRDNGIQLEPRKFDSNLEIQQIGQRESLSELVYTQSKKTRPENLDVSTRGLENKTLYPVSQSSFASDVIKQIRSGQIPNHMKTGFASNALILKLRPEDKSKISLPMAVNGFASPNGAESKPSKSHEFNRVMYNYYQYVSQKHNYLLPTHADKSTNYAANLIGNVYSIDPAGIKKYLLDEINSNIEFLKDIKENQEIYKQFKKSAWENKYHLGVFEGEVSNEFYENYKQLVDKYIQGEIEIEDIKKAYDKQDIISDFTESVKNKAKSLYDSMAEDLKYVVVYGNNVVNSYDFIQSYLFNKINNHEAFKVFYGHPAFFSDFHKRANYTSSTKDFMATGDVVLKQYVEHDYGRFQDLTEKINQEQDANKKLELQRELYKLPVYRDDNKYTDAIAVYKSVLENEESTDEDINQALNNLRKELDNERTLTLADKGNGNRSSNMLEDIISGISKDSSKFNLINNAYTDIEKTDAAAWVSLDFWKTILDRTGNMTPELLNTYAKMKTGEPLTKRESGYVVNAIKAMHSEVKLISDLLESSNGSIDFSKSNQAKPVYHKYALIPLIPEVIKGTELEKINEEMVKKRIGYVTYTSGSKASPVVNPYYGDYLSNPEMPVIYENISLNSLGVQVDLAPKMKNESADSTQARKIIFNNLRLFLGEEKSNEYFRDIANSYAKYNQERYIDFSNKYGIDPKTKRVKDPQAFYKKMVDSLEGSAEKKIVIDGLKAMIESKRPIYIDFLSNKNKVESSLMALFVKDFITNKWIGESYIQVASTHWQKNKDGSINPSNQLKFYRKSKDGSKILPAEIAIPIPKEIKDFYIKDDYSLEDLNEKISAIIDKVEKGEKLNLLEKKLYDSISYVGNRIPVQGYNSLESFVVKKFLPEGVGPLVMVPEEIAAKSGGDYDVDKLQIYRKFPDAEKNAGKISQNEIISKMFEIITLQENYESLITPNNADYLKNIAYGKDGANTVLEMRKNVTDPNVNNKTFVSFNEGKLLVGVFALNNTYNALFHQLNIDTRSDENGSYLTFQGIDEDSGEPYEIKHYFPFETNSMSDAYLLGDDMILKSDVISQLIDGSVDVAKDDWIFNFGVNLKNASGFAALIRKGVRPELLKEIFTSPIVQQVYFKYNERTLVYKKTSQSLPGVITELGNEYIKQSLGKNYDPRKDFFSAKYERLLLESKKIISEKKLKDLNDGHKLAIALFANTLGDLNSGLIKATNYDTVGNPGSLFNLKDKIDFTENLRENNIEANFISENDNAVNLLLNNKESLIGAFYDGYTDTFEGLASLNTIYTAELIGEVNNEFNSLGKYHPDGKTIYSKNIERDRKNFANDYMLYLVQNNDSIGLWGDPSKNYKYFRDKYLFGDNAGENKKNLVSSLKNGILADNLFIKDLTSYDVKYTVPKAVNSGGKVINKGKKSAIIQNSIQMSSFQLTDEELTDYFNDLSNAFIIAEDLANNGNPELLNNLQDLLGISFFQGGFNYSRTSFTTNIPPIIFSEMFTDDMVNKVKNDSVNKVEDYGKVFFEKRVTGREILRNPQPNYISSETSSDKNKNVNPSKDFSEKGSANQINDYASDPAVLEEAVFNISSLLMPKSLRPTMFTNENFAKVENVYEMMQKFFPGEKTNEYKEEFAHSFINTIVESTVKNTSIKPAVKEIVKKGYTTMDLKSASLEVAQKASAKVFDKVSSFMIDLKVLADGLGDSFLEYANYFSNLYNYLSDLFSERSEIMQPVFNFIDSLVESSMENNIVDSIMEDDIINKALNKALDKSIDLANEMAEKSMNDNVIEKSLEKIGIFTKKLIENQLKKVQDQIKNCK